MFKFKKSEEVKISLTFNGFPPRIILNITKLAQKSLLMEKPTGDFHIPFINKNDVGSHATFKCKEMADRVKKMVDLVVTHDFPEFCGLRILLNLFHHCIEEQDVENFIYHVENQTIFLLHPNEGVSEKTISKMNEMLEKYLISHPIVLVSELFTSCPVKLSENEMLIIPCGMKTFLKPIYSKDIQFMKAFSKTIDRITKNTVDCKGIDFYEVKDICKQIEIKGVYFFITPENVELTGLPFNVKNFSEILKRRLKEHQKNQSIEVRVVSRK